MENAVSYRWLILGCVWLLFCSPPKPPVPMTLDQAIALARTWGREVKEPFSNAQVFPNGDFRGQFGGAELYYLAVDSTLYAQGLVQSDASLMAEDPEDFDEMKRAGDREPSTMGEGKFYLERTPHKPHKAGTPKLALRKAFRNGAIEPRQFVVEVDWLMEWSTYWRKQRSIEVQTQPEAELIQEAPEIEAWAKKNRPRPW